MTQLNNLPNDIKSKLLEKVLIAYLSNLDIVKWLFDEYNIEAKGIEVAKFRLVALVNRKKRSKPSTQLDTVKAALLNREPVNAVVMFNDHITRLSAIIKRLRNLGWQIVTDQDNGNGLAHYSLPEGWQSDGDIEQSAPKCCK